MIFEIFMDLLSPKTIKELLNKYGAAPLKQMGQNFLINRGVLQKIICAANLDREDTVLEIGPGLGQMTQELAKRVKKVIAIEKDKKFVEILKETLKEYKNVEVIQDDILKTKKLKLLTKNYKLIANLPYYITSPVIRKFLEIENKPKEMILMVQKEVAQRICACPPSLRSGAGRRAKPPQMSLLAVSVQFYAQPKILGYASKGSFWPQPKVDSAILRLKPYSDPNYDVKSRGDHVALREYTRIENSGERFRVMSGSAGLSAFRVLFFKIVKAGFSAPRKQLAGNLSKKLGIKKEVTDKIMQKMGIDPKRRAETLNVEDWIELTKLLIEVLG